MQMMRKLTPHLILNFTVYLREQERAPHTIQKYTHDLNVLSTFLHGDVLTKARLIDWKDFLVKQYAAASVNTMLAAVNGFFDFCGWSDLKVKPLKIQKAMFCTAEKELTREEYVRLVNTAKQSGNERLSLVLQTICATGIRVSELQFITVEATQTGKAEVTNKGKRRTIFLPEKLRKLLKQYSLKQSKTSGSIFLTKTGKPLDRSNIWRDMKLLCAQANVAPEKVFPHNLRHLFARTYYSLEQDLSRLADILGHSNINTTRIYTMESGVIHAKQMERMNLISI